MSEKYPYFFSWGNNEKRALMKGRKCRILARGKMNSVKVEFENGQVEIISGNALRKVTMAQSVDDLNKAIEEFARVVREEATISVNQACENMRKFILKWKGLDEKNKD